MLMKAIKFWVEKHPEWGIKVISESDILVEYESEDRGSFRKVFQLIDQGDHIVSGVRFPGNKPSETRNYWTKKQFIKLFEK